MPLSDDELRKLRELGDLRDEGVLTQAEFDLGKTRLLEGSADVEDAAVAVVEAPADGAAAPSAATDELVIAATPSKTPESTKPLSAGVIAVLAVLTAGIGVPIYLLIKGRRKAAAMVAAAVLVMFIAFGASESSSSSDTTSSDDKVERASAVDDDANDAAAEAEAEAAAEKQAAEERAAEAVAAKEAAAQAAAEKRQLAAVAAKRRALITNAAFPDERTLALVLKNPDAQTGKMFRVWGEVMQFDTRTGTTEFLASVAIRNTSSYGFFDGETALFSGTERQLASLVQDDLFTVVVEVVGSYDYDTAAGGTNSVAHFKIVGGLERQGSNAS